MHRSTITIDRNPVALPAGRYLASADVILRTWREGGGPIFVRKVTAGNAISAAPTAPGFFYTVRSCTDGPVTVWPAPAAVPSSISQ